MRILANFTKKVNTGAYENETFTVTFEAETEFNNIERVADYLFCQCRAAVERQLNGKATPDVPSLSSHEQAEQPKLTEAKNAKGKENTQKERKPKKTQETQTPKEDTPQAEEPASQTPAPKSSTSLPEFPVTDKQRQMLFRLANELGYRGENASDFLHRKASEISGKPVTSLSDVSRKTASRLIDKLLEAQRKVA